MILTLARLLPGTPERDLWAMDVERGLQYLAAAGALADAAAEELRAAGSPGPAGAGTARTGGLEVLGPYLRGARHGV